MTEGLDVTPPQDIAAEQALLGLAMSDPRHLAAARAHLNGGAEFYRPIHGDLWRVICAESDAGHPTDSITISAKVINDRTYRRTFANNPSWLFDLVQAGHDAGPNADSFARIIHDAYRLRHWREVGERIAQLTETAEPDEIDLLALDHLEQAVKAVEHKGRASSWAAQDLTAALAGHELDPPPEHLRRTDGHALLYAAAVHTLAGEPGTGKTWIALHGAVQAMQGGHNAALIDFEDRASRVVARLLMLGARPDWLAGPSARFRYVRPTDPLTTETRQALEQATSGCALVILDGVTEAMTMHGYDLNSNQDAASFYALLPRRITDTSGAAVVMIDHVTKDSDNRGRWAIGGQHKLAGIDGAAYQVKAVAPFGRGAHGIARITISKDRPGHVQGNALGLTAAEFHLDTTTPDAVKAWLEKPNLMPTDDHGEPRPTIIMGKVSAYIEAHPECSAADIEAAVRSKRDYVRRAVQCLVNEGYVEVFSGPRNSKHHRSVRPFGTDEE
jgi:hypothetical protein